MGGVFSRGGDDRPSALSLVDSSVWAELRVTSHQPRRYHQIPFEYLNGREKMQRFHEDMIERKKSIKAKYDELERRDCDKFVSTYLSQRIAVKRAVKRAVASYATSDHSCQDGDVQWVDMSIYPTMSEVVETKNHLAQKLPLEIVDLVMDFADFWPHTSSILEQGMKDSGSAATPADLAREGFLLGSLPLGIRCAGVLLFFVYPGHLPCPWLLDINLAGRRSPLVSFQRVARPPETDQGELHWLRPRNRHPARMVIIETLHRGDSRPRRPGNTYRRASWYDVRKTNFLGRTTDLAGLDVPCSLEIPLTAAGVRVGNVQVWRYDDDFQPSLGENDLQKRDECIPRVAKQWRSRLLAKNLERRQKANFVRFLEVGHSIGIWAGMLGSGYSNHFEGARLHVFWAV